MILLYASYLSVHAPIGGEYANERSCLRIVAGWIGEERRAAVAAVPGAGAAPFHMCSTVATATALGRGDQPSLMSHVARECGAEPVMMSAYECAGWGYSLRRHPAQAETCLMIVDADTGNFGYWHAGRVWGKSGFGIATLVFGPARDAEAAISTGVAAGANPLMDFARAVRKRVLADRECALYLPFFPAAQFQILQKAVGVALCARNGHERYGHCFGADPWIALLDERAGGRSQGARVLCASLAFGGYFCVGEFELGERFVHGGIRHAAC